MLWNGEKNDGKMLQSSANCDICRTIAAYQIDGMKVGFVSSERYRTISIKEVLEIKFHAVKLIVDRHRWPLCYRMACAPLDHLKNTMSSNICHKICENINSSH